MDVLLLGGDGFAGRAIGRSLRAAGRAVVEEEAAPADGRWDACVDARPPDAAAVREALGALGGRAAHYVLLSTHAVYPAAPTPRPWREEDCAPESELPSFGAGAAAREAERALAFSRGLPWTILRPAIVEGPDDPTDRTWRILTRILDGGPVLLPDGGPPVYRHVHADDLGEAVRLVAGEPRAFGRVLNVADDGLLTPLGHALMLMDGLGRRVPVHWVPAELWRAAGLPDPMGQAEATSLVEPSPLLTELGWRPRPPVAWVEALARQLATRAAQGDRAERATERRVFAQAQRTRAFAITPGDARPPSPAWMIRAAPGQAASAHLERLDAVPRIGPPLLRTRAVAFGETVERLLTGDLPAAPEPVVVAHAAVLELVEPGPPPGPTAGTRFVPLARAPCADAACPWCADRVPRWTGVDADGFAAAFVTAPYSHLVAMPASLGPAAILVPALARLLEAVEPLLLRERGPVAILGTTVDAALLANLAHDAGRRPLHVDRAGGGRAPGDLPVWPVRALADILSKENIPPPSLGVNLSGAREGENLLSAALAPGGVLVSPFAAREPLPPAAATREALEEAAALLVRWSAYRDVAALVGPAVAPETFSDAFLSPPFRLAYVEGA